MRALAPLAAAIATLVAANAAKPALAADHFSTEHSGQVTVRLADLDLSTAGGARTALARLRRAAGEACGDQPTGTPELVHLSSAFQRCRAATLETAVASLPPLGGR